MLQLQNRVPEIQSSSTEDFGVATAGRNEPLI